MVSIFCAWVFSRVANAKNVLTGIPKLLPNWIVSLLLLLLSIAVSPSVLP